MGMGVEGSLGGKNEIPIQNARGGVAALWRVHSFRAGSTRRPIDGCGIEYLYKIV